MLEITKAPPQRDVSSALRAYFHLITQWVVKHWAPSVLAGITCAAALLALYWVFLIPIYQAPDEEQQFDYILSIYSSGTLLNVRDRPVVWIAHPTSLYLEEYTGARDIAFHSGIKAPPGYGTSAYFQMLDRSSPPLHIPLRGTPWLVRLYPFGYFALVALWLGLLSHLSNSLVVLFFSARIFSVLLLVGALPLCYAIARELRLRRPLALLLTAITGLFPLTSFVASAIQADTLSFLLVSLSLYTALLARRALHRSQGSAPWRREFMNLQKTHAAYVGLRSSVLPPFGWTLCLLGTALGLLAVTKYQFYLCVLVPAAGMLLVEFYSTPIEQRSRIRWRLGIALLLLPSVLLGLVQFWVSSGSPVPYIVHASLHPNGIWSDAAVRAALAEGAGVFASYVLKSSLAAFRNYYLGGLTSASFWGLFGWLDTPLVIATPGFSTHIRSLPVALTLIIIILALARRVKVLRLLVVLFRSGRWRQALRLAFSNPVLNSYFLFTGFMFYLYVWTNNTFVAQGRNWFPFLLPAFLNGIVDAPRAISYQRTRTLLSSVLALCLALYCALAGSYAVNTIQQRYYGNGRTLTPLSLATMKQLPQSTRYAITYLIPPAPPGSPPFDAAGKGNTLAIGGWAVDTQSRTTAGAVIISVDGLQDFQAVYGDNSPEVASELSNPTYRKAGFDIIFPTDRMTSGRHYFTLKIVTRDRRSYYNPPQQFPFEIP